jgi:hypothetical protein
MAAFRHSAKFDKVVALCPVFVEKMSSGINTRITTRENGKPEGQPPLSFESRAAS